MSTNIHTAPEAHIEVLTAQAYYKQVSRYAPVHHVLVHGGIFYEGDVFEVCLYAGDVGYLKVQRTWQHLLYQLIECTADGTPYKSEHPDATISVTNHDIVSMIDSNIWRLYGRIVD